MLRGETKSGVVISGDMILKWKRIWSQVAAGLRSPFRQKGPTSARAIHSASCSDNGQSPGNLKQLLSDVALPADANIL